jgi:hypothetical protein
MFEFPEILTMDKYFLSIIESKHKEVAGMVSVWCVTNARVRWSWADGRKKLEK